MIGFFWYFVFMLGFIEIMVNVVFGLVKRLGCCFVGLMLIRFSIIIFLGIWRFRCCVCCWLWCIWFYGVLLWSCWIVFVLFFLGVWRWSFGCWWCFSIFWILLRLVCCGCCIVWFVIVWIFWCFVGWLVCGWVLGFSGFIVFVWLFGCCICWLFGVVGSGISWFWLLFWWIVWWSCLVCCCLYFFLVFCDCFGWFVFGCVEGGVWWMFFLMV